VNRTATYRNHRVILGAPRSGKTRRVDLPHALVGRLTGRELSPWVFPSPSDRSKPMNGAFVRYKVWYRVLRRAGVRQVRVDDLRHTYQRKRSWVCRGYVHGPTTPTLDWLASGAITESAGWLASHSGKSF
jgi:integrase